MAKRNRKRNRDRRQQREGGNPFQHATSNNPSVSAEAAAVRVPSNPDSHVPAHSFPLMTKVVRSTALGSSLPPLVITYTNEQAAIQKWLKIHVSDKKQQCLGLDTESKPCFTREAAKAARGPDTLQLAVADGHCLVIHLSRMETMRDLSRMFEMAQQRNNDHPRCNGFSSLVDVLKNKQIAKAGVGVDDDALELHKNHTLDISCRLDLRSIDSINHGEEEEEEEQKMPPAKNAKSGNDNDNHNDSQQKAQKKKQAPNGLKVLAEKYVEGLVLPKKKRLQMSNWAASLNDDQVAYAAADAFAGVSVVAALTCAADNKHTYQSMIETALADELEIHLLEEDRARKKQERQRKKEKERREKKVGGGEHKGKLNQNAQHHHARQNTNSNKRKGNNDKEHPHSNKRRKTSNSRPKQQLEPVAPIYDQLSTALRSSR